MATSPLHDLNAFSGSPARNWRLNILKKQEELDYAKAALLLFDDFRSGKLGRITLEWVKNENDQ